MGLDMYLTARKYIPEYSDAKFYDEVNKLTKAISDWDVREIVFEVAYWRKANQIHNWFVKNVQGGVDDCKDYYLDKEDITKLYDTVCEVLKDKTKADLLLPSASGFFFGSTEYDEYYFQELEYTKESLKPLVDKLNSKDKSYWAFDFYYRSSW